MAWDDTSTLQKTYWDFLTLVKEKFADTVEHVVIRTAVSFVSVCKPGAALSHSP
ncbi:MAG TPA: hypothetical protein VKH37_12110 [Ferruginibacter sp.]|nr:hypothetical protein [Ferruginibacter sp.]